MALIEFFPKICNKCHFMETMLTGKIIRGYL